MLGRDKKAARSGYFLLLYTVLGLAAVFWVPYFVPLQATASPSYHFGYNNRAGIIFLAFLIGAGAIWTRGTGFPFLEAASGRKVALKVLFLTLVAVLVGCAAMYLLAGRFGGFGESSYEIDRIWMLSEGKVPYLDFEWPFGASFLYIPLFLSRLLSIDVVRAAYIFWGINFLIGTCLLFAVINMIDYPTTKKTSIFLLLMVAAYPAILCMGTHYALLRHVCPLFFILLVQRAVNRKEGNWRGLASFLAVTFTTVLLLISPETALAHAFACICIFLLDAKEGHNRSGLIAAAGLVGAFAVIFLFAARFHVLDTMRASGGGADSFPIIPAPHILLFVAGLFLCAGYVYQRLVKRWHYDNTISLLLYSVPMVAASLGRCDPGHVFLNGMGVFIACLFYISNHTVAWKWCRNAFLCFILITPTVAGLWLYRGLLASVALNSLQEGNNPKIRDKVISLAERYIAPHLDGSKRARWEKRLRTIRTQSGLPIDPDLSRVYPQWRGEFAAPFGYRPNHIGTYLNNRIDYGFYEGWENANTPAAVTRKINDLRHHPQDALLLPNNFDDSCRVDDSGERQVISILFFVPYRARAIHMDSVYRPLCDYIHSNYKVEDESAASGESYNLWVAKPLAEFR